MNFEIDVSGKDLLTPNYTICVANTRGIIKGFKFSHKDVEVLNSRFGQGLYNRYKKSKKSKSSFKVRIYCVVIYYLFKSIKISSPIALNICRDFDNRFYDIKSNLNFFLSNRLGIKIENINFCRLDKDSDAHKYACLMGRDTRNQLKTYVKIGLSEIEEYLKK